MKISLKAILSPITVLTLISLTALAGETNIGNEYPSLARGTRPLGMGNAFLTMKGTDDNAIFYNPAAINDFDNEIHYSFLVNPTIEMSQSIYSLIKDTFNLNDDLNDATTDAQLTQIFKDYVNKRIGEFHSININYPVAALRHHYFYVATLVDSRTTFSLRNRVLPNFEFKTRNDGGIIVGGAYGFLFDDLQVGIALKFLYRIGMEEIVTVNKILVDNLSSLIGFDSWKRGFGVGIDLGVKYRLPVEDIDTLDSLNPTIAITYQDIGNTRFTGGAPSTPQSISAGLGIHPVLGDLLPALGNIEASLVVDFREINQEKDILNKFHLGTEVRFPTLVKFIKPSIRLGCNQGYLATGFGIQFIVWRYQPIINFAYYGEESGKYGHRGANYRLAAEIRLLNF